MPAVHVRYRVRPECSDENVQLITAVFEALAVHRPAGFRYESYRLTDGVTFVHVAQIDEEPNPLASLAAFSEFQRGLGERCEQLPEASAATLIGSYKHDQSPTSNTARRGFL